MAERVDRIPDTYNALYPWDEWMDGSIWKIELGVDVKIPVQSFRVAASRAARQRGRKARISKRGNTLYLRAEERT